MYQHVKTEKDVETELDNLKNDKNLSPFIKEFRLRVLARIHDKITGENIYKDVFCNY